MVLNEQWQFLPVENAAELGVNKLQHPSCLKIRHGKHTIKVLTFDALRTLGDIKKRAATAARLT
jgi:hypothetical protein